MNEKIKQLVEKAPYTTVSTEGRLFSQQDLAKFAELIVRECIFELVHESTLQSNREVQDFTVNVVNRFKERFALEQ